MPQIVIGRRKLITGIATLFVAPAIIKVSAIMPINPRLVPEVDPPSITPIAHWLQDTPGMDFYGLRGRETVKLAGAISWAAELAKPERHICETMVGEVLVSTIFLVLDHSHGFGEPVLFETMAFQADPAKPDFIGDSLAQERYRTYAEAESGHERVVQRVREIQAMAKLGIKA